MQRVYALTLRASRPIRTLCGAAARSRKLPSARRRRRREKIRVCLHDHCGRKCPIRVIPKPTKVKTNRSLAVLSIPVPERTSFLLRNVALPPIDSLSRHARGAQVCRPAFFEKVRRGRVPRAQKHTAFGLSRWSVRMLQQVRRSVDIEKIAAPLGAVGENWNASVVVHLTQSFEPPIIVALHTRGDKGRGWDPGTVCVRARSKRVVLNLRRVRPCTRVRLSVCAAPHARAENSTPVLEKYCGQAGNGGSAPAHAIVAQVAAKSTNIMATCALLEIARGFWILFSECGRAQGHPSTQAAPPPPPPKRRRHRL